MNRLKWIAAAALALAGGAQAATHQYRCDDRSVIEVTSTPFNVRVKAVEQQIDLARVTGSGDARFINQPQAAELSISGPMLDMHWGERSLWCKLVPFGTPPENIYVPPRPVVEAASAPASAPPAKPAAPKRARRH